MVHSHRAGSIRFIRAMGCAGVGVRAAGTLSGTEGERGTGPRGGVRGTGMRIEGLGDELGDCFVAVSMGVADGLGVAVGGVLGRACGACGGRGWYYVCESIVGWRRNCSPIAEPCLFLIRR